MENIDWNKCFICGKEFKVLNGSHLKTHNISKIEYIVKYRNDLNIFNKEFLINKYYNEDLNINDIVKLYSNYNIKNLKDILLSLFEYYNLKTRTTSEAQKLNIKKMGLWNKGKTKFNNKSILEYSKKKSLLYKQVNEVRNNLTLSEALNYSWNCIGIYNIIRKRLLERQDNRCLLCNNDLDTSKKRSIHIHHIDRNSLNNNENNLSILCSKCHGLISLNKHRLTDLDRFNTYNKFKENNSKILNIIEMNLKRNYKDTRREYKDLIDKNNCIICNSKENLHIHHLDFNNNNNDINNLCILCSKCHNKVTGAYIISNSIGELIEKFSHFKKKKILTRNEVEKLICSKKIQSNLKGFIKLHKKK